jgi:hypothetical protein
LIDRGFDERRADRFPVPVALSEIRDGFLVVADIVSTSATPTASFSASAESISRYCYQSFRFETSPEWNLQQV